MLISALSPMVVKTISLSLRLGAPAFHMRPDGDRLISIYVVTPRRLQMQEVQLRAYIDKDDSLFSHRLVISHIADKPMLLAGLENDTTYHV